MEFFGNVDNCSYFCMLKEICEHGLYSFSEGLDAAGGYRHGDGVLFDFLPRTGSGQGGGGAESHVRHAVSHHGIRYALRDIL